MDGWTDGWMGELMGGRMDRRMHRRMNGQMDGQMDSGWLAWGWGWDGVKLLRKCRWMDGWMERGSDWVERVDGWTHNGHIFPMLIACTLISAK